MEAPKSKKKAKKQKCNVCSRAAEKSCGNCHCVSYCSVEHQKQDWKAHKVFCSPFRFEDDPRQNTGAGKFAVATRDLSAGTIILEELPLFQAPLYSIDSFCIACGFTLPPMSQRTAVNSCSICNIPVCGDECAKMQIHAQNECLLFKPNNTVYPFEGCDFLNDGFPPEMLCLVLRSIAIINRDPTLWKQLMKMADWEPTCDAKSNSSSSCILCDRSLLPTTMPVVLKLNCKQNKLFVQSELFKEGEKVVRLFTTQGYENFVLDESERPFPSKYTAYRTGRFIYKKARHFTHSCVGNCEWEIGNVPDFKIRIRTLVPVKQGETLTTSRIAYSLNMVEGTLRRQEILHRHFRSSCRCELCKDATEFGTYESAVVCTSCTRGGYLLPLDPLSIDKESQWQCDKCFRALPASKFLPQIFEIGQNLANRSVNEKDVFFDSPLKLYKEIRETYCGKVLHPNHWILQLNTTILMGKRGFEKPAEAEEGMRYLLKIQNKTLDSYPYGRMIAVVNLSELIGERIVRPPEEILNKTYNELLGIQDEAFQVLHLQTEACEFYKNRFPLRVTTASEETKSQTLRSLENGMKSVTGFLKFIDSRLLVINIQRLRLGLN